MDTDGLVFPTLLSVSDVVSILRISRSQVYKLISEGEIPAVYIRRTIRVKAEEIHKFLEKCQTNESTMD